MASFGAMPWLAWAYVQSCGNRGSGRYNMTANYNFSYLVTDVCHVHMPFQAGRRSFSRQRSAQVHSMCNTMRCMQGAPGSIPGWAVWPRQLLSRQ